MANCCDTQYVFYGKNESVRKLYDFLSELDKKVKKEGVVIKKSDGSERTYHCLNYYLIQEALNIPEDLMANGRGDVVEIQDFITRKDGQAYFELVMSDGWSAYPEIWENILERRFTKDIKLAYKAEEPGCEVFFIEDPDGLFFKEKYLVDAYLGEDSEWEYFTSEKDCYRYSAEKIGRYCENNGISFKKELYPDLNGLQELIRDLTDDGDYFFNIHKFQIA